MSIIQSRIIYDLCGGTGSWSKPYADAGYNVRVIDIKYGHDVRLIKAPNKPVHGVLAAPPCQHFSIACTGLWKAKEEDGRLLEGLSTLDACIRFIFASNPVWWALENPTGRMVQFLGPPVYKFNPNDFGDAYTKKTYLWGKFERPKKKPVKPIDHDGQGLCIDKYYEQKLGINHRPVTRSITPPGFAAAFFEANP